MEVRRATDFLEEEVGCGGPYDHTGFRKLGKERVAGESRARRCTPAWDTGTAQACAGSREQVGWLVVYTWDVLKGRRRS